MYFDKFPTMLYDFDIKTIESSGTQAVATATISNGTVSSVTITNGGSGYASATVSFPTPLNGTPAQAKAILIRGVIVDIVLTDIGSGYTSTPSVIISAPRANPKTETRAYLMTDITRNVRFRRDLLANITVYDSYDIVDGETPEIIAEKVYGSAEYHWVVMLANERYDYLNDFPLTYVALERYIESKYDNPEGIHHYVDDAGYIISQDGFGAIAVSNRQHEETVNESKRRIKIISRDLLSTIMKNYKDSM